MTATAIPIPQHSRTNSKKISGLCALCSTNTSHPTTYQTTPSLQSVLDQKRSSLSGTAANTASTSPDSSVSTYSTASSSHSIPSLVSLSSSFESCSDSHPLQSYSHGLMNEIDEDFFSNADIQLVTPLDIVKEDLDSQNHFNQHTKQTLTKKSSFVSNLTQSIKKLTNSTMRQNDFNVFNIQPRLTDDKFIQPYNDHNPTNSKSSLVFEDTELVTFNITARTDHPNHSSKTSSDTSSILAKPQRGREQRINPEFLRLYSFESSSRKKHILPEISMKEEDEYLLYNPTNSLDQVHTKKEFALFIRRKLWDSIVLPPRENLNSYCDQPEYVFNGDGIECTGEFSLIRKLGDIKPWIKFDDEKTLMKSQTFKPRGVIGKGIQFTAKGWCNARWIPSVAC